MYGVLINEPSFCLNGTSTNACEVRDETSNSRTNCLLYCYRHAHIDFEPQIESRKFSPLENHAQVCDLLLRRYTRYSTPITVVMFISESSSYPKPCTVLCGLNSVAIGVRIWPELIYLELDNQLRWTKLEPGVTCDYLSAIAPMLRVAESYPVTN